VAWTAPARPAIRAAMLAAVTGDISRSDGPA
jgi:hypothetical protein